MNYTYDVWISPLPEEVDPPSMAMAGMQWLGHATRKMFYMVTPSELALDDTDPVPKLILTTGLPMFFLMIVLEWAAQQIYAVKKMKAAAPTQTPKVSPYSNRIVELLNCVGVGAAQQLFAFTFDAIGVLTDVMAYSFTYTYFRADTIPVKEYPVASFVALMLLKDLAYYWNHRVLHEYHLLWASHSVHHSGEDYNLSTGLRQGAIQHILSIPFMLPMAVMGFPPSAYGAHAQLNTMYQFWVHTDLVNRMPFGLEYIINTPMAHRMHHRPPGNCNYGGVLIIWDRLFGTYQAEEVRKDYYGLAKQPRTFDPVKLNTQHYKTIAKLNKSHKKNPRLNKVFARRVPWKWEFSFQNLLTPIPQADRPDLRTEGPVRQKYKGNPNNPKPFFEPIGYGVRTFTHVSILLACTFLLLKGSTYERGDAAGAGVVGLILLSCIGRMWDNNPGEVEKAFALATTLLPVMVGFLAVQPFNRFVDVV